MSAHVQPHNASTRNVLLLTVCAVIFLSATITVGFIVLPPDYWTNVRPVGDDPGIGPVKLGSLLVAPLAYLWICTNLAGGSTGRWKSIRYAMLLQYQVAYEIVCFVLVLALSAGVIYLVAGWSGDLDTQQSMRDTVTRGHISLLLYAIALSLPAFAMLISVWRLHALSRKPGALAAAVNGTLCHMSVRGDGDADDVRSELVRHLERLVRADMPGLGRLMTGSHPKLTSRDIKGELVHELTWLSCPMKLLVSCPVRGDGCPEIRVQAVLRGTYKAYIIATPADAVALMQYAEAHLLKPLTAQLAKVSAERQRDALRDQAVEAQLRILQAQIEPHFLFNTLANVRQLYRASVADGESMMDHLIAYLRCAMDDLRAEHSSIVKEMDLAMHFLSIMKIRMGERLSYHFSIPESLLHHAFPPAMLISLIENAIKHGLADCDHGEISMSALRDGQTLRVTVADNGAGFSSVGGTGVGLSNIRQRLETMYGTRAWLEVGAPASGGFTATIVIPFERNH